jgi:hypothetical protein
MFVCYIIVVENINYFSRYHFVFKLSRQVVTSSTSTINTIRRKDVFIVKDIRMSWLVTVRLTIRIPLTIKLT